MSALRFNSVKLFGMKMEFSGAMATMFSDLILSFYNAQNIGTFSIFFFFLFIGGSKVKDHNLKGI